MSKTFKEWLEIGGRQDHYGEYDMEESWDAAQKAMLDEVKSIIKKKAQLNFNQYEATHYDCYKFRAYALDNLLDELNQKGVK